MREAESQLRDEPAHRLRNRGRDVAWSFDAPNGVGVYVEAVRTTISETEVAVTLSGATAGWFNRHRLERQAWLPITGHTARLPEVLYLVF